MAVSIPELLQDLRAETLPCTENEPLARHTTFRIGGPAAVFCQPCTAAELMRTLELCRAHHVRTYLLGNGSNVLFADAGFPGAVVCLTALASQPTLERQPDGRVALKTGAGVTLAAVCRAACAAGLTGLEFAYGIPGTAGGAVYMNAGAYGGEIKDALASAAFLDERLRLQTLPTPALALGYRTSVFETKNWCILEATFLLKPDPQGPAADRKSVV